MMAALLHECHMKKTIQLEYCLLLVATNAVTTFGGEHVKLLFAIRCDLYNSFVYDHTSMESARWPTTLVELRLLALFGMLSETSCHLVRDPEL